jgi:MFS family permease
MALKTLQRSLAEPNCRIYFGGSLLAWTGMWMQRVAIGWMAWELSESTFWIGLIAFADLVPAIVVSPLAGAIADRADRLRLTVGAQLATIAQAMILAILAAAHVLNIHVLVFLALVQGITGAFAQPARQSMVPALVPRELLPSAVALNSLTFNLARVLGPGIAGPLIVAIGPIPTVIANALACTVATATMLLLQLDPAERTGHAPTRSLWAETLEGFTYAARHPGIGPLFLYAALLGVLVRPFQEMLPAYADQVFGRGADGLAWLTGTVGLGALVMGLVVAGQSEVAGLSRRTVVSGAAMTLATLAFAATTNFALGLVACFAAGAAMTVHGISAQTLAQFGAESHVRGRMMALWGLIVRACPALGAVLLGTIAEWTGLSLPTAAFCVIALGVVAWGLSRVKRMQAALEKER